MLAGLSLLRLLSSTLLLLVVLLAVRVTVVGVAVAVELVVSAQHLALLWKLV
jgi:hypothetical protein